MAGAIMKFCNIDCKMLTYITEGVYDRNIITQGYYICMIDKQKREWGQTCTCYQ